MSRLCPRPFQRLHLHPTIPRPVPCLSHEWLRQLESRRRGARPRRLDALPSSRPTPTFPTAPPSSSRRAVAIPIGSIRETSPSHGRASATPETPPHGRRMPGAIGANTSTHLAPGSHTHFPTAFPGTTGEATPPGCTDLPFERPMHPNPGSAPRRRVALLAKTLPPPPLDLSPCQCGLLRPAKTVGCPSRGQPPAWPRCLPGLGVHLHLASHAPTTLHTTSSKLRRLGPARPNHGGHANDAST